MTLTPEAPSVPPPLGGAANELAKPDSWLPLGGVTGPVDGLGFDSDQPLNATELSRLKWRTRRGLLENDLFIERFFRRYESQLLVRHANGLNALMSLADNDLLDLHLGRKDLAAVEPALDTPDAREVLNMLKEKQ
jgi:antitoxin CptB